MHKLINIRKNNSTYLPYFQPLWSHIIMLSIISFVVISSVMNLSTPTYNNILSAIFNIGILISGGFAGYFSLKQDRLYLEVASMETEEIKVNNSANIVDKVYNKPGEFVSDEEARNIISSLKHHLANDKPYLNRKLGVNELAKKIGITKQKLTYVVNDVMETNFYGIINKYRILEAKEMLKKPHTQNYKIDVISQIVGFQSKSSFNACFKKITGLTPSEFRKNNSKGKHR
ncbi:MAG: helix-turn-helix transcriptional regulator [Bacteroidetes bacterium]|nr:helix-turn-helix transcriptional regulator [Bacteroidota bacterium]